MKLRDLLAQIHKGLESGLLDEDSDVELTYEHDEMERVVIVLDPEVDCDKGVLLLGNLEY